ncbi:hypothetical protein ACFFRR_011319 [Megaselia abdita]
MKKSAPATAKKPSSTVNVSSNIPKQKSSLVDAKNTKTVESTKKFSIRRPSTLGINKDQKSKETPQSKPQSARPSNTKIVQPSRPSTASSNLNKPPGKLPSYLKRFNSQKSESQGTDKLKAFNALKTKLRDAQSEFFKALDDVKETQPDGLQEEYKFVALVKSGNGKLIVNESKDVPSIEGGLENKHFLSIKEKINLMKGEIASVTGVMVTQIQSLKETDDFEKAKVEFGSFLKKIEEFADANKSQTDEIEKFLNELADNSKAIVREIDNQELESKLQTTTQALESHKRKLELVESRLSEFKLKEQSKELESKTKEKQLIDKETEITKLKADLKSLEDLKHKNSTESSKLKLKVRNLEVELNEYKEQFERNATAAEEVIALRSEFELTEKRNNDLQELFKKETSNTVKLQSEIKEKDEELSKAVDDLEKLRVLEDGSNQIESELVKEIRSLKFEKDDLIEERNQLEKEKRILIKDFKSSSVEIQVKYNEALDQLKAVESSNVTLKSKMAALEESLNAKSQLISELESLNHELKNSTRVKEMQNELTQLRESDVAKKRDIQNLKIELSKSMHEVKQREEELMLHQRILKVRSELIDSMQQKENSTESRICDLLTEIGKQSNHINQVNFELASKTEELQNLFSTLGAKQLEIARQEHLIKMLEETNERNEDIKKNQSNRIEQLETDIMKLKDSVEVYEKHLLVINESNRSYLLSEHHKNSNSSRQSFANTSNDYENERRRKRKLEVHGKQIEK